MRTVSPVLLLLTVLASALPAAADPMDTVGVSWAGRSTAGACTAGISGAAAAAYNPALVGGGGSASFFAGGVLVWDRLSPEVNESRGAEGYAEAGVSLPLADFGELGNLWFGLTGMTPPTSLYDIDLYDDTAPVFLTLGSRERRLSLSTAVAWNLWGFFGIGAGFEVLPTVDGSVVADLANPEGHNELHVDVGYRLSPTAGLLFHVHPWVRVGVNYRAQNVTRITLPVEVEAEGIELAAEVTARTYFVPHRLFVGVEGLLPYGFALEADLGWYHYSGYPQPSPTVSMDSAAGNGFESTVRALELRDVVSPSLSLKFAHEKVSAALGYRYTPAATSEQAGAANLLDNGRHRLALGGRVGLAAGAIGISGIFLTADLFLAWLDERRDEKAEWIVDNPGFPAVEYGGLRLGGGLGIEVEY